MITLIGIVYLLSGFYFAKQTYSRFDEDGDARSHYLEYGTPYWKRYVVGLFASTKIILFLVLLAGVMALGVMGLLKLIELMFWIIVNMP